MDTANDLNLNKKTYGWTVRTVSALTSSLSVKIKLHHDGDQVEQGQIFLFNHFARFETFIPQFLMHQKSGAYCRSIAAGEFFRGNDTFANYLRSVGAVPHDLPNLLPFLAEEILRGRKVIIFPEGTRSLPGQPGTYQPGVAAIYKDADVPLIPVAVNSGSFWGRSGYMKYPGCIVMEVLPAIPQGLDRKTFMKELQSQVDGASERLRLEGEAKYSLQPATEVQNK